MTADELAHLVAKLTATWPTGVRGNIWTIELAHLDTIPARHTYEHLVRSDNHPPSVARFFEQYHALTTPLTGPPPPTDTGPAIALTDHIERLEWRATINHDHTAITELNTWRTLKARAITRHPSTQRGATMTDTPDTQPDTEPEHDEPVDPDETDDTEG